VRSTNHACSTRLAVLAVLVDGSGNGFQGTLVNNPTFVAGHSGRAVNLNGTNQFVRLPRSIQDSFTRLPGQDDHHRW
jgi:hypothetical protein